MDPAAGPPSGALALKALSMDAVISRVLAGLSKKERRDLRAASKGLGAACLRQVTTLKLVTAPVSLAGAFASLRSLINSGIQPTTLDLGKLRYRGTDNGRLRL